LFIHDAEAAPQHERDASRVRFLATSVPYVRYFSLVSRVLHIAQPLRAGVAGVVLSLMADQMAAAVTPAAVAS
jgi:hypothetical protein